ncbi:mitofilin family membrane protein [Gemmobacter sp.]|uniref:mitofilin family membrane protein n=1 Tax=Gemmobacter sp. TaxID=1898957 RepID=UPI002AFF024F|nr:mitofilin family membrane protein [Gemmobacter sp.]
MTGHKDTSEELPEPAAGQPIADAPAAADPVPDHPATALPDPASLAPAAAMPDPAPPPETPPPPARKGNPLLPVLGGVVAAAIGFGLAQVVPDGWPLADTTRQISALDARIAAQDQKLAAMTPATGLADRIAAVESQVGALPDPAAEIAALRAEIAALQQAATPELEALRAEVAQLRNDLAAVPREAGQELEALKAAAQAERQATEARAAALQAEAEATAKSALARGAVLRVQAALDAGGAFDTALTDLGTAGIAVPAALSAHAEGVPTLVQLQSGFPDAARAALAATQAPNPDAPLTERLGAFLKAQTGMRSVTPRAGDDPDALLSRAEAALHKGDLPAALAELDKLPPEGTAALADWRAQAMARAEAAQALATLATDLNTN